MPNKQSRSHAAPAAAKKTAVHTGASSDWINTGYLVMPQPGKSARRPRPPVPPGMRPRVVTQPW